MTWDLDRAYRDHLTSGDLAVLADLLRDRPLTGILSAPEIDELVFALVRQQVRSAPHRRS